MLRKIRSYIVQLLIKRHLLTFTRTKNVVNLSSANTIGIIFVLENEDDYKFINKFISQLTNLGKEVKIIGFIPNKVIPNFYVATLKMDIITKKDLNLLGISKKSFVEIFIQESFDLLIDLSVKDYLALDYIAGCSHASFKTGRYREGMVSVFDFLISKPEEMENRKFLETVINYLSTINTK